MAFRFNCRFEIFNCAWQTGESYFQEFLRLTFGAVEDKTETDAISVCCVARGAVYLVHGTLDLEKE